jgi:[ribosomal protein S18]-alanine N-acetyltransferase
MKDPISMETALEFCKLRPALKEALAELFETITSNGDSRWFHPHPFTAEKATELCAYRGRDLYYVALAEESILGYGMLRGWDEGYEIPSLGIVLHPSVRGSGLGSTMMHFLHSAARFRGAKRVRLKVYRDNIAAKSMYEKLGYVFEKSDLPELVGFLELKKQQCE